MSHIHHNSHTRGVTLLITLLVTGVLLGISTSLLNITLKQYSLSSISAGSEVAFQTASAAMECALYYDRNSTVSGPLEVPSRADTPDSQTSQASITCMGDTASADDFSNPPFTDNNETDNLAESGNEQRFQFEWGNPAICSEVSVFKFHEGEQVQVNGRDFWDGDADAYDAGADNECPTGVVCTVIQARGYNLPCASLGDTNGKVVEREITQVY